MQGSNGAALIVLTVVCLALAVFYRIRAVQWQAAHAQEPRTQLTSLALLARTAAEGGPIARRRSACECAGAREFLLPHACARCGITTSQASGVVCRAHLGVGTLGSSSPVARS